MRWLVRPVRSVFYAILLSLPLLAGCADLASQGHGGPQQRPHVRFDIRDQDDRLVVREAAATDNWNFLLVRAPLEPPGLRMGGPPPHQNEPATPAGGDPSSGVGVSPTSAPVRVGDYLEFCALLGARVGVTISIEDAYWQQAVGAYSFESVKEC